MNNKQEKFSKYFIDSIKPEWKNNYINYIEIKKDIFEKKKEILEKFKTKNFISFYGKNDEFTNIIDDIKNKIIDNIENIHFSFEELERNLVSQTYKWIVMYKDTKLENYKLFLFLNNLNDTINTYNELIQFINLNLLAVVRLLNKLDKEFNLFENKILKNFFKENLTNKDNKIKKLIFCERTIKCFFIMKKLYKNIDSLVDKDNKELSSKKVNENSQIEEKMNSQEINDINIYMESQVNLKNEMPKIHFKEDSVIEMNESLKEEENYNILEIYNKLAKNIDLNIDILLKVKLEIEKIIDIEIINKFDKEQFIKESEQIINKDNLTLDDLYKLNNNKNNIDEIEKTDESACYSLTDLWLVLIGTFFYIFNYYGWSINAKDYLEVLKLNKDLFGIVNAVTPFTAFLIVFLFNYTTDSGFKKSYYSCLIMLLVGNLLYIFAFYLKSLAVLLIGKGLVGLGGCRLLPRKFLAIMVREFARTKYSAIFVGMTCIATGLGPGLVYYINSIFGNNAYINDVNKFSIFMIIVWVIYSIVFIILFKDNQKEIQKEKQNQYVKELAITKIFNKYNKSKDFNEIENFINLNIHSNLNYFYNKTIKLKVEIDKNLNTSKIRQKDDLKIETLENLNNKNDIKDNEKYIENALNDEYKEITDNKGTVFKKYFPNSSTIIISLTVLFNKMIQETFLSELSFTYETVFGLTTLEIGYFFDVLIVYSLFFTLGLIFVSKKINDKSILLFALILITISCLLKSDPFLLSGLFPTKHFWYYNITSALVYISTLILEGSAISLLSKIINPSLQLGYFNSGLITGICDTLGRAVGNAFITMVQFIVKSQYPTKDDIFRFNTTLFILYLFYCIANAIFLMLFIINYSKITKYYKISIAVRKKEEEFDKRLI